MRKKFYEKLKILDFVKGQNLYFTDAKSDDPYIRIALEEAKKFKTVTAIYFRRFETTSRPPLAQAYIFDYSDDFDLPDTFGETVKNIWLTGKIPLIYTFTKTEVNIFSGYKQPAFKDSSYEPSIIEKIEIAVLSQNNIFSAKRLDNGTFWDEAKYQKYFKFENTSYEILLKKLKQILNEIVKNEQTLDKGVAREFYQKFLLRAILVKYLEERVDENGDRIFPSNFFSKFSKSEDTFIAVLEKKGAVIELFQALENQFNGNIFRLNEIECDILENKNLSLFLRFFDDYVDQKEQLHIWQLYSFNYLPIELISNIYEEFLPKIDGVVYTPPFLVDFLIDRCMPLKDIEGNVNNFKVIDPSCGSGVFIVAAFKRLVQAWRLKNEWKKPPIEVLKNILSNCIYGIDIKRESIQLAAFSLTIALCDQLSPKKIRELKFDDLTQKNLIEKDFFSIILNENNVYDEYQNAFDLVIGNPPFESEIKNDALKLENKMLSLRDFRTPDKQLALLFLEQVSNLCKNNKQCCLIQKGGPLLYNLQSSDFSNYLFQNFNISYVYDFSALKPSLYGIASVETAAVFLQNTTTIDKDIYHIVLQQTKANKNKMFFELDRYDIHRIDRRNLEKNRNIWTANLLGGGRLHTIANSLNNVRSLKDFLISKKKNGWKYAEGFIALTPKPKRDFFNLMNKINPSENERRKLQKLKQKYTADYLTGKPYIPIDRTTNFTSDGINQDSINNLKEKYFYRKASNAKEIFSPPHLLIRKLAPNTGIPIEYRENFLSFTSQIIAIHSHDSVELIRIANWIKHNRLLVFCVYLKSSIGLTSRPGSFLMDDILSIPYPENPEELKLSSFEQILIDDVLDYQIEFRRKGEKAKIMHPVEKPNLLKFSKVYLKVLNSVYKEFKAAEPIHTTSFICYPFFFGDEPEQDLEEFNNNTEMLEEYLENLIRRQTSSTLRINRILRIYEKNIIYLIKPNQLRYWLKSIAIRDADETVADFIHQGF